MTSLLLFAVTTAFAPPLHATPPPATVNPTRVRWCSALLAETRRGEAHRTALRDAVARAAAETASRLGPRNEGEARIETGRYDAVRVNLYRALSPTQDEDLRRLRGRLAQLELDLATPEEEVVGRLDVGAENIVGFLDRLSSTAQILQDTSGEFENGDPPFNRRAYARHLSHLGLVGALAVGLGGGTAWAVETDASNGVLALLASSTYFSLVGLWDIHAHYRRSRDTREGRIRTENNDVDRVDVELEALARMRAVAADPAPPRGRLVAHAYSLHLPRRTFEDLMNGEAQARGLSRRPFRFRRGEHTVLIDLVLFENARGELSLLSSLRAKATHEIPRSFLKSRVVGDL